MPLRSSLRTDGPVAGRAVRRRSVVGIVALATLLVPLGACSDDEDDTSIADAAGEGSSTSAAPGDTNGAAADTATDPATGGDAEVAQDAPAGANGIKVGPDETLWIAVLAGDEILHVDPTDGTILGRWALPDGAGPDDLVLGDDGSVYLTTFNAGNVVRLDPTTGDTEVVGTIGAGANPIAWRADGTLVAGRAVTASGLFALGPAVGGDPTPLADPGNVNSFDVGDDGVLYAPLTGAAGGSLIAVDPDTGETQRTVAELPGIPVGARWHDGSVVALVLAPTATVVRVDPTTGAVTTVADTGLAIADNLAVAADGTIYVTGFDQPTVVVVSADGSAVTTMTIGGGAATGGQPADR